MNKSTLFGAAMIAAAAVAVPVIAWSDTPAPTPGQEHHEHGGHGRWAANVSPQQACVDRIAKRAGFVAFIGAKLNLTDAQKPLWEKVVAATQAAQASERQVCAALPASADDKAKQTVIDRLNHRQQMMQAQLQAMQQTTPLFQAFYQSLTPEQKAMLDHPHHRA
jgi:hypothetical protein